MKMFIGTIIVQHYSGKQRRITGHSEDGKERAYKHALEIATAIGQETDDFVSSYSTEEWDKVDKEFPIKNDEAKPDSRYQLFEGYFGNKTSTYEISFCGEYKGQFNTWLEAYERLKELRKEHKKEMGIESESSNTKNKE